MSEFARGGIIERPPADKPPIIPRGCGYVIPAAVARRYTQDILEALNKRTEGEK